MSLQVETHVSIIYKCKYNLENNCNQHSVVVLTNDLSCRWKMNLIHLHNLLNYKIVQKYYRLYCQSVQLCEAEGLEGSAVVYSL